MHPPWITFNIFLILLIITNKSSGHDKKHGEDENSNVSRMETHTNERERRLIPYMTYYVTRSLANPNPGSRHNIFIPVTTTRENIFDFDTISKIPTKNLQNVNLQHLSEIIPKPVARFQNQLFLTAPAIQTSQQVYRIEPGTLPPRIQSPIQPQQSEAQPLQVIKVNQVSEEQKLSRPQLIKIIPLITDLPSTDRSHEPFISQSHYGYTNTKLQTLLPNSHLTNVQNYYKRPVTVSHENSFPENKVYEAQLHPNPANYQVRILGQSLRPEKNKFTNANIFLSSTTPSPYITGLKPSINDAKTTKVMSNLDSAEVHPLKQSPTSATNGQESPVNILSNFSIEKYKAIVPSQPQQIFYNEETNDDNQSQINPQQLQPILQSPRQPPRLRVPQEENIRFVATVTPISVNNELGNTPHTNIYDENKTGKTVNVYNKASLDKILSILKDTNALPQNLTPENIDTGIKALAIILERLQQQKNYQQIQKPVTSSSSSILEPEISVAEEDLEKNHKKVDSFPQRSGTSTPGRPGIDYPTYSSIPQTNFDCSTQRYKGFFGDPDTKCQVWHYCDLNGGQASFLCPNGTIFSQVALTCDWWFNVKCASTSQLYVLNERLYKYILPFSPSFPEDFSGPIVDTYLTAKFKEMEAKSKNKALKSLSTTTTTSTTAKPDITTDLLLDERTETVEEYRTISQEK